MDKNFYKKNKYKMNRARRDAILSMLGENDRLVLDIGCGNGYLGGVIKEKREIQVHGVDMSEDALEEASKKIDKTYFFDISKNDWPEDILKNKYDKIILSEVLEHIFYPEDILEKIKNISHKNTEIIITVPNLLFWKNRLKIFFGNFEYKEKGLMDRGHIHFFSWKSFQDLIRQSGHHIVDKKHHIPTRGTKFLGKIFPGLFSYQFIVKIKKNNIAIYTAIFGGKDGLIEPKYIPKNCDFICFTDADLKSKIWQVRKVEPDFEDPVRDARQIKILPHKYLADYKYSIWVDGNILVRSDINELIDKYLKNKNIAIFDHNKLAKDPRDCVYKEAEALIKMSKTKKYKDDPELIKKQVEEYRGAGYPENNGLISSMVILRRHNSEDVKKTMEDWWCELKNNSRRDQLSFNYVAWKNKLDFVYMEGDSRDNKYFLHTPHKKKYYV